MYIQPSPSPEPRPLDQNTLRSLAAAYLAYGLPAKALSILNLATWLDGTDTRTTILLAYAAFRSGDYPNGIAAVDRLRAGGSPIPQDLVRYYQLVT